MPCHYTLLVFIDFIFAVKRDLVLLIDVDVFFVIDKRRQCRASLFCTMNAAYVTSKMMGTRKLFATFLKIEKIGFWECLQA